MARTRQRPVHGEWSKEQVRVEAGLSRGVARALVDTEYVLTPFTLRSVLEMKVAAVLWGANPAAGGRTPLTRDQVALRKAQAAFEDPATSAEHLLLVGDREAVVVPDAAAAGAALAPEGAFFTETVHVLPLGAWVATLRREHLHRAAEAS